MKIKNLLFIFLATLCLNACASTKVAAAYDENGNKIEIESFVQSVIENKDYLSSEVSFYDIDYNYYVYHIGDIKNIPLESQSKVFSYFGGDAEYTFSLTEMTSETMQAMTSRSITKSVSYTNSQTASISLGFDAGQKDVLKFGTEAGYSMVTTNGQSQTKSWSESYSKCESYSKTVQNSIKIKLNSSCEHGYYRYMLFGDIHVYATIVKDRVTGETRVDTFSEIFSYKYGLDFKKDDNFSPIKTEKISVDLLAIENCLGQPSYFYDRYPDKTYVGKSSGYKINSLSTHTIDYDISSQYNSLVKLGYNKIDVKVTFYVEDSIAKLHGFIGYSPNKDECLSSFDRKADGFTFSESFNNLDLSLFETYKKVYLILTNESLMFSYEVSNVEISVTFKKIK